MKTKNFKVVASGSDFVVQIGPHLEPTVKAVETTSRVQKNFLNRVNDVTGNLKLITFSPNVCYRGSTHDCLRTGRSGF
jgi:hypothetical protein